MAQPQAANVIAFADHARSQPPAGLLARLSRAVTEFRTYRSVHDELSALTDRELVDLDISRLNVRDIARAAAYGR